MKRNETKRKSLLALPNAVSYASVQWDRRVHGARCRLKPGAGTRARARACHTPLRKASAPRAPSDLLQDHSAELYCWNISTYSYKVSSCFRFKLKRTAGRLLGFFFSFLQVYIYIFFILFPVWVVLLRRVEWCTRLWASFFGREL